VSAACLNVERGMAAPTQNPISSIENPDLKKVIFV
jgi:hypothetical protein